MIVSNINTFSASFTFKTFSHIFENRSSAFSIGNKPYFLHRILARKKVFRHTCREQLKTYCKVPSPRGDSRGGTGTEHMGYLLHCTELHSRLPFRLQPTIGRLCKIYVIDNHHITLIRPQRRQIAQVTSQLSAGMRSGETFHVRSERNIVFRIENSYCHSVNLQFTNRFCLMTND